MPTETCPLCRRPEQDLRVSHFLPAALYSPRKKKKQYRTRNATGIMQADLQEYLLCGDCETRFNTHGEGYVLKLIAPKSKRFPLHEKLRLALPRSSGDRSALRFSGEDLGLDMDKFAYFALRVVWRGAVHQWMNANGTLMAPCKLGDFEEMIRQYLAGEAAFPSNMAVMVLVASDDESRRIFSFPEVSVQDGCLNFRFYARGVFFRVMMGHVPQMFRDWCCTSPRKCLFYGDGKRRASEVFAGVEDPTKS
jgi:hypothetical protein